MAMPPSRLRRRNVPIITEEVLNLLGFLMLFAFAEIQDQKGQEKR
jgi:hypothetical protein